MDTCQEPSLRLTGSSPVTSHAALPWLTYPLAAMLRDTCQELSLKLTDGSLCFLSCEGQLWWPGLKRVPSWVGFLRVGPALDMGGSCIGFRLPCSQLPTPPPRLAVLLRRRRLALGLSSFFGCGAVCASLPLIITPWRFISPFLPAVLAFSFLFGLSPPHSVVGCACLLCQCPRCPPGPTNFWQRTRLSLLV